MTDAERAAHAREKFAGILSRFLSLPKSKDSGSVTIHFHAGKVKRVEWRYIEDVESWDRSA